MVWNWNLILLIRLQTDILPFWSYTFPGSVFFFLFFLFFLPMHQQLRSNTLETPCQISKYCWVLFFFFSFVFFSLGTFLRRIYYARTSLVALEHMQLLVILMCLWPVHAFSCRLWLRSSVMSVTLYQLLIVNNATTGRMVHISAVEKPLFTPSDRLLTIYRYCVKPKIISLYSVTWRRKKEDRVPVVS